MFFKSFHVGSAGVGWSTNFFTKQHYYKEEIVSDGKSVGTRELIFGQAVAVLFTAFVIYVFPKINLQFISQQLVIITAIAATAYFGLIKPEISDTIFISFMVAATGIFFCNFVTQYTGAESIWKTRDFIFLSIFLMAFVAFAITSYVKSNRGNTSVTATIIACFLQFWIVCAIIVKPDGVLNLLKDLFTQQV